MVCDIQPHIRCSSKDAAKYAIMPGDPKRVERIKKFLENPIDIAYNREFKSCIGTYKGVEVMAVSTGVGGASAAIAIEELKNIGVKALIRIGSCGALQDNIKLGDLIIGTGAIRNEGTSKAYIESIYPAVPDYFLLSSIIESANELKYPNHIGIVRSHDGLYNDKESELDNYWKGIGAVGADMESAAFFVVGGIRKVMTASILNVVVETNGKLDDGINDYVNGESITALGEKREILTALEAIVKLDKNLLAKKF